MAEKMTYNERLQITAKKHADKYNAGGGREYAGGPLIKNDPEHMMDEAELTISEQAEAIRESVRSVNDYDSIDDETILSAIDSWIDQYLIEHGYIEPKNGQ